MGITSEGSGEMLEGDIAYMCRKVSTIVDGGTSESVKQWKTGMRGPHRAACSFKHVRRYCVDDMSGYGFAPIFKQPLFILKVFFRYFH